MTDSRRWLLRQLLLLTPFALSAILVLQGPLRAILAGDSVGDDFRVFYVGAELFDEGRFAELWNPAAFAETSGLDGPYLWYAYPPFYARASLPLTALAIDQALVIWTLAGLALLPLTIRIVAGRWDWWLSLLAVTSFPAAANFQIGQNAVIGVVIVGVSFALVSRGRLALGGVVFGLLVYKPQLVLGIALWWLLDRRYRTAAWSALATAAAVLGASLAFDLSAWREYWSVLPDLASVRGQPIQVSLTGFMDLAFPNWSAARSLGMMLGLLALAGFGWWVARRERPTDVAFALAVAVTLLAAPYVIIYDYLILLAPIVVLLQARDLDKIWLPAVALSWLVFFTYVLRDVAEEWIGAEIQLAPLALGLAILAVTHHFGGSSQAPPAITEAGGPGRR